MIDHEISFTSLIKKEIIEYHWTKRQLEILFFSFLKTNGVFKDEEFIFTTTLINKEEYINNLFKEIFLLNIIPTKTKNLLKYKIKSPEFMEIFFELGKNVLKNIEENKAYISGVFLGKGWVNSPKSRFYHCEFRIRDLPHSLDVQESLDTLGIKSITIIKNNWHYTYIKKASNISTIIGSFNASQSLMFFEDSRIERDFIATYKKMESIEWYNIKKTRDSSEKQIKLIKRIFLLKKESELSDDQINISKLRLKHPDYSLFELQMEFNHIYNKDVSKSTISFWLNKIVKKGESIDDK